MGKGGYSGGSTIIYRGGHGWSYDPLAKVPRTRNRPIAQTVFHPSRETRKAETEWLNNFATSCAACAVLRIGFPPRKALDERYDKLFDGSSTRFHHLFRAKIGSLKGKARIALDKHIDWVAKDILSRKPTSNLPKALQYCLLHPRFRNAIEREVEIRSSSKDG